MGLLDSLHQLLGGDIGLAKAVGRQINPFDRGASFGNPTSGNAGKGTPQPLPWRQTPMLPQGNLPLTSQAPAIPDLNRLLGTANIGINGTNFSATNIGIPGPALPDHTFYLNPHINPIHQPLQFPVQSYLPRIGG